MNDYPTTLRVIAAFKAGEDLAVRLESAVKAQNAMADALKNAADHIERLEALRVEDGKQMSVLIAECQEMKDRLVDGADVKISCKKTSDDTQPVAWAVLHKDHQYVSLLRETAEAHNVYVDAEIVPLYRSPQPALTETEREAVEFFAGFHTEGYGMIEAHAATLRKLLERLK
jgi:hypothetical protein